MSGRLFPLVNPDPYVYACLKCRRTAPASSEAPVCCGETMVLRIPGFVPAAWSPK